MADDPTMGELARRLDRVERQQQDLAAGSVSPALYGRDRDELKQDIVELRAALDEERRLRREAVREVYVRLDKSGTNWRQALFSGVLPALFFIITITVTILLALRGGAGK